MMFTLALSSVSTISHRWCCQVFANRVLLGLFLVSDTRLVELIPCILLSLKATNSIIEAIIRLGHSCAKHVVACVECRLGIVGVRSIMGELTIIFLGASRSKSTRFLTAFRLIVETIGLIYWCVREIAIISFLTLALSKPSARLLVSEYPVCCRRGITATKSSTKSSISRLTTSSEHTSTKCVCLSLAM
jgi:hypothetical protein